MANVSLHTGILSSPKHGPLSDAAFRLWTHALCWAKEHVTDGYVPAAILPKLHPRSLKLVGELLCVRVAGKGPLWHETAGGFQIHDFSDWQETKARVQERRRQWRDRQNRKRDRDEAASRPPSVTPVVTRESPVSHANPPSDVSGVGVGVGVGVEPKGKNTRPPAPASAGSALFERWYAAYPRQTQKKDALHAFKKLQPTPALVDTMLTALAWQSTSLNWTEDGGRWCPYPATWLNAEQWTDDRSAYRFAESGAPTRRTEPGDDVWGEVLEHLNVHVTRHDLLTWFKTARLVQDDGHVLRVAVADATAHAWIQRHYLEAVTQAAAKVGRRVQFDPPQGRTRPQAVPQARPA